MTTRLLVCPGLLGLKSVLAPDTYNHVIMARVFDSLRLKPLSACAPMTQARPQCPPTLQSNLKGRDPCRTILTIAAKEKSKEDLRRGGVSQQEIDFTAY